MKAVDSPGVAAVEVASWRAAYDRILPGSWLGELGTISGTRKWLRRLRRDPLHHAIAELDGQVVGYVGWGPTRDLDLEPGFAGEIYSLYVHPEGWGSGIGARLHSWAWEQLAGDGYLWGVLWVVEQNHRARHFYERQGLETDGRTRWTRVGDQQVRLVRYARPVNPMEWVALETTRA